MTAKLTMRILRIIAVTFISIYLLFAFLCPALEIAKIKLFTEVGSPYQLTIPIEYVYLAVALILPIWIILSSVFNFCYKPDLTPQGIELKLLIWTLLWLSISVLYTLFTRDDIGGEPFYCPSNIAYNSTEFYVACKIRAANFVSMWLFALLAILLMLTIPAGLFPRDEIVRDMTKDIPIDVLGLWTNCDPEDLDAKQPMDTNKLYI
ncbi:hypothetical protein F8M41_012666 [Gigaspora margarita]|uniref:Uncharacterized protein n=1 Tax=Gigaspora margarita TaxID=4874 RepID=A0A8H3ZZH9_GIGMA|nr:hypothetical protein F8M41_012666 [Gigaspora margarita]